MCTWPHWWRTGMNWQDAMHPFLCYHRVPLRFFISDKQSAWFAHFILQFGYNRLPFQMDFVGHHMHASKLSSCKAFRPDSYHQFGMCLETLSMFWVTNFWNTWQWFCSQSAPQALTQIFRTRVCGWKTLAPSPGPSPSKLGMHMCDSPSISTQKLDGSSIGSWGAVRQQCKLHTDRSFMPLLVVYIDV